MPHSKGEEMSREAQQLGKVKIKVQIFRPFSQDHISGGLQTFTYITSSTFFLTFALSDLLSNPVKPFTQ